MPNETVSTCRKASNYAKNPDRVIGRDEERNHEL